MHDEQGRPPAHVKAAHTPAAIRERLAAATRHSYLRDFVYGAIDGAVTTFAVVCGVAGAELSTGVIVVLGAANLLGDGFSMAASNYLGTRTEEQLRERARRAEEREIDLYPEGEREEIRQIVRSKGFEGADLERAVKIITSDRKHWIDMMMTEEHGLPLEGPSAIRAAGTTFLAFVVVGLIPLLPFFAAYLAPALTGREFLWSALSTAAAFFGVGAVKSRFIDERWYWSGLETLFFGGIAAVVAYVVGALLKGVA
jgi:VIT1/CCC1 family predicted Fe2+/Mn2+ transporter